MKQPQLTRWETGRISVSSRNRHSRDRQAIVNELLAQLDLIEGELRRLGWWRDAAEPPQPPDANRMFAGLTFPHWLQYVFLPNARSAVHTDTLPASSQVGLMAMRQYDYHSTVPEALPLVDLLHTFDRLVERAGTGIR